MGINKIINKVIRSKDNAQKHAVKEKDRLKTEFIHLKVEHQYRSPSDCCGSPLINVISSSLTSGTFQSKRGFTYKD